MMALGELPAGWLRAKLSDVIEPRGEKTFPAELPDLPFLGMDHVEAQTTRILGSVPASSMKSSAARFFAGDVLYGRLRPYLNKVAQPNFHGLASAEFIVFPDTELLHSKFLRFRLNAADFVSFASHLNEGDRPRVNFDQIGEFELLVPPPAEQHRIVAKIEELFSELDQGVASLKTAREQLKVYRQSLLKNAFEGKLSAAWRAAHCDQLETAAALQQRIARERQARYQQQLADWQTAGQAGPKPKPPKPLPPLTAEELAELPELPAGWGWAKLGSVMETTVGFAFKSAEFVSTGGVRLLRGDNIEPGRLRWTDARYWPLERSAEFAELMLAIGEIIIAMDRPVISSGLKVARVHQTDLPSLLVQRVARIKEQLGICTDFVYAAINQNRFVNHCLGHQTGTQLPHISEAQIRSYPIPLCSLAEQVQISAELDAKLSEADQLDQTLATALQQADALRQSILKKAFCGQLVKQAKNEEPATALLERIRAARATSPAKGRQAKSVSKSLTNC